MRKENSLLPARHVLVSLSQGIFLLLALIWTILAILSVNRPPSGMTAGLAWLLVGLIAGNVLALLFSAWGIGRGGRWLYRFAVVVVGVNLILSLTDEFGLLDLLSLLLDGLLLLLLLAARP